MKDFLAYLKAVFQTVKDRQAAYKRLYTFEETVEIWKNGYFAAAKRYQPVDSPDMTIYVDADSNEMPKVMSCNHLPTGTYPVWLKRD